MNSLLQLCFASLLIITGECLTVSERSLKVCHPQDINGSVCIPTEPSLMKQTYQFSTAANSDILARDFTFNEEGETTTSHINNRIGFECPDNLNPIDEVIQTVIPQLSKGVDYINKFSSSCLEVITKNSSAESGYYRLRLKNGTLADVYCDMVGTDCEDLGGWTRVGYFNMAESGTDSCPSPLVSKSYTGISYPLCQRESYWSGCDSFYFDNMGIEYISVCGRALGWQRGSPDSFKWSWYNIDQNYVDGLAISYGSPRKHIWTFVGGHSQEGTGSSECPCNHGSYATYPSFVGNNYYCESGKPNGEGWSNKIYTGDKLWDGKQCETNEDGCCKVGNTLPWFSRLLSPSTTSKIELRLCDDENEDNERVPLELVEIYVR